MIEHQNIGIPTNDGKSFKDRATVRFWCRNMQAM